MTYEYKSDVVHGIYDPESKILRFIYHGSVTPDVTIGAYQWLDELLQIISTEDIYCVYTDYRNVHRFNLKHVYTTNKESRFLNEKHNLSNIPVAIIVRDMYQEKIVRASFRILAHKERLKIVFSENEALAFANEFHTKNSPHED